MRARGFVRRWVEDALGLSDLVERLEVLEGLDLEETVDRVTGLEVQVEAYALEGASDRERIEALEARVETVAAAVKGVLDLLEANLSGVRHD